MIFPIVDGKNHGFRLRFSLKQNHWISTFVEPEDESVDFGFPGTDSVIMSGSNWTTHNWLVVTGTMEFWMTFHSVGNVPYIFLMFFPFVPYIYIYIHFSIYYMFHFVYKFSENKVNFTDELTPSFVQRAWRKTTNQEAMVRSLVDVPVSHVWSPWCYGHG